jgi:hypothetical protein
MAGQPDSEHGYSQTRDDIPRESPILGELASLHAAIDRMEHQTGRIRGKLEPVLSPRPQPESAPSLAGVAGSMAYQEIHRAAIRIATLTDMLVQTVDELEV